MNVFETLKELNSRYGPSGCEEPVRDKIAQLRQQHRGAFR